MFQNWMHSIHWYSGCPKAGSPPVLLVGTFKDKLPVNTAEKDSEERTLALREKLALANDPSFNHLAKDTVNLTNKEVEKEKLKKLKEHILDLAANHLENWDKPIPATWLLLLKKLKSQQKRILDMEEVKEMNEEMVARISSEDGLLLFLKYQHEVGELMFYDEEGLRHKVILDLKLHVDALKYVFCSKQFCLTKDQSTAQLWIDLSTKGELSEKLIDCVWKETKELKENKDVLLAYMARSHVIAELELSSDQKSKGRVFLAPCMLENKVPVDIRDDIGGSTVTSAICFVSKKDVLPAAVFHRLTAACLQDPEWTLAERNRRNMIFSDFVEFKLNETSCLQLFYKRHVIQMRMLYFSKKADDLPRQVFEKIEANLLKISRLLNVVIGSEDALFELCFKCKNMSLDIVDDLTKYSKSELQSKDIIMCSFCKPRHSLKTADLIADWFMQIPEHHGKEDANDSTNESVCGNPVELMKQLLQKQEETHELVRQGQTESKKALACLLKGQGQIMNKVDEIETRQSGLKQEELNVLCLHTAISSVCTQMMCDVMLKTVPNDDVNFYSAVSSQEPELKKSALSKAQKDELFRNPPPPNGIGIVKKYDITGLYAIIRNISTVKPELEMKQKGRIIPRFTESCRPSENPRDTSTGANVERIKTIRNVFKHANDLTISVVDLKSKWDAMEAVADDLHNAGYVDGPKCKADLAAIKNKYKVGKSTKTFKEEYKTFLKEIKGQLDNIIQQLHTGSGSS